MRFLAYLHAWLHMASLGHSYTCDEAWADDGSNTWNIPVVVCGDAYLYQMGCTAKECW